MPLIDLKSKISISYRSGRDDLVKDFYVPCLERAVMYRRAVGYFTSSGLAYAARGVASMVDRKGKMRLVASPYLEEGDVEALSRASERPEEILKIIVLRNLREIEDALIRDRINALAWLIANDSLEVRLALRLNEVGKISRGIFHEKMGIFTDADGNHVAFAGSANETAGGLVENFESIKVFWSWEDPQNRVAEEISNFEALWNNQTPGLRVLDFTDISRDLLKQFRLPEPPHLEEGRHLDYRVSVAPISPGTIPPWLLLRDYQREAIRAWLDNKGRGILAMATGAGKTIVALYLACKVAEKNKPLALIVVCPFLNLAYQWVREMAKFGFSPVPCFESRKVWEPLLQEAYQRLTTGLQPVIAMVVTNATFLSSVFQSALRYKLAIHLLIADEVHNLGAHKLQATLSPEIPLRLGLSATPERHRDEEGTRAIFDYFGDVVYEFGIAEAIKRGVLVPYTYHPVLVDLTPAETDDYLSLTEQIIRLFPRGENEEMPEALRMLLIKRARLLASAAEKLPALSRILREFDDPVQKAIVYCGDGRVECPVSEEDERQILAVTRLLGDTHHLRVRKFTCEEPSEVREEILTRLSNGEINAVVAIRCLDEGIDVPDARVGFLLASSTNPRQFIQRRGRLLRRSDETGKKRAVIYDFIVRPPDLGGNFSDDAFNLERKMFTRELRRILEFCQSAENGPAALNQLRALRLQYNLLAQ